MSGRLLKTSILVAMRSRRRFIPFTLIYTVLIFLMAWFIENKTSWLDLGLWVCIFCSIGVSLLYTQTILYNRKTEIATLKCIGWTNSNVKTFLLGEVIWAIVLGFIIDAEILIHYAAGTLYYNFQNVEAGTTLAQYMEATSPLLSIPSVFITLAILIVTQIIGILYMNSKILKLRPIVALRVYK